MNTSNTIFLPIRKPKFNAKWNFIIYHKYICSEIRVILFVLLGTKGNVFDTISPYTTRCAMLCYECPYFAFFLPCIYLLIFVYWKKLLSLSQKLYFLPTIRFSFVSLEKKIRSDINSLVCVWNTYEKYNYLRFLILTKKTFFNPLLLSINFIHQAKNFFPHFFQVLLLLKLNSISIAARFSLFPWY